MKVPSRNAVLARVLPHPARATAAVGLLALVGAGLVWLIAGTPRPQVHDEASYLLAADTYARGRLANPPHPHWEHFEVPHVIHQPTYASKYQPAQGMVMALTQRLLGHPLPGVWLAAAALAAAMTWMLYALVPAPWALVGGVLTALQFSMAGVWAQSYWGGAVPALGATLLFGALARLRSRVSLSSGAALAAGSLILVFSRPYEGFVVFLFAVAPLFLMKRPPRKQRIRAVLVSLAAATILGGTFMALYNEAVTGDPFTLPYQLHTEQYGATPLFVFQAPKEAPEYRNERLERFHMEWERSQYETHRSLGGWLSRAVERPVQAARDEFFGPPRNFDRGPLGAWIPGVLILPVLLLPWLLRRPRARYGLVVIGALFVALSMVTYFVPHYVAVLTPIWMYLVVESLRIGRRMIRAGPGRRAVVPLALCLSVVLVLQSAFDQGYMSRRPVFWHVARGQIEDQLRSMGGEHLLLVRYSPTWSYHWEWVYNTADIDTQQVVWARSLDPEADASLLEYYADRRAWSLYIAPGVRQLEPIRR